MYYHPKGRNHFVSKSLYVFKSPKDRYHEMIVAYTEGGAVLADVTQGMSGYIWHCYLDNNNIYLKREDLDTTYLITTKENVSQLDVTFDQSMRPFICYVADDLPYYYHFNTDSNVYSEVPLDPSIKFPRCELDTRDEYLIHQSDIILGYTREGNLCYRLQRERFLQEYLIATNPNKSMLWRIGRTKDNRFAYQWR